MEELGKIVDPTRYEAHHTIQGITQDDINAWLKSPILKPVLDHLNYCGILLGIQYEEGSDVAKIHLSVPFDIKAAIIERERPKR